MSKLEGQVLELYRFKKTARTPKLIKGKFSDDDLLNIYVMFKKQIKPFTDNAHVTEKNVNVLTSLASRLAPEEFIDVCNLNVFLSHKANETTMLNGIRDSDPELYELIKECLESTIDSPIDTRTQQILEQTFGKKPHIAINKAFNTNLHSRRHRRGELNFSLIYNPQFYIDELVHEPKRDSQYRNLLSRIKIWVGEDDL